jgi:hypothetical protein
VIGIAAACMFSDPRRSERFPTPVRALSLTPEAKALDQWKRKMVRGFRVVGGQHRRRAETQSRSLGSDPVSRTRPPRIGRGRGVLPRTRFLTGPEARPSAGPLIWPTGNPVPFARSARGRPGRVPHGRASPGAGKRRRIVRPTRSGGPRPTRSVRRGLGRPKTDRDRVDGTASHMPAAAGERTDQRLGLRPRGRTGPRAPTPMAARSPPVWCPCTQAVPDHRGFRRQSPRRALPQVRSASGTNTSPTGVEPCLHRRRPPCPVAGAAMVRLLVRFRDPPAAAFRETACPTPSGRRRRVPPPDWMPHRGEGCRRPPTGSSRSVDRGAVSDRRGGRRPPGPGGHAPVPLPTAVRSGRAVGPFPPLGTGPPVPGPEAVGGDGALDGNAFGYPGPEDGVADRGVASRGPDRWRFRGALATDGGAVTGRPGVRGAVPGFAREAAQARGRVPGPPRAVVDHQDRRVLLDVEAAPGRGPGLAAFPEPQVDVGFSVVHGPLVGLGHVELHATAHGAGGPPAPDPSGVEQGASRRLVVPGGPAVEGVDPVQFHEGVAVTVVGPHHLGAQHRGVHGGAGSGRDREPEQGPAGVDTVPREASRAHAGRLGAAVGPVGEGAVHVGPRGARGLGPTAAGVHGGERAVCVGGAVGSGRGAGSPVGRGGLARFAAPLPRGAVPSGDGRAVDGGGGLLVGCGGSDHTQRNDQGVSRTGRRRTGQGTTHYGWCLHISAMTEKEYGRDIRAPLERQGIYQIPPAPHKPQGYKYRPKPQLLTPGARTPRKPAPPERAHSNARTILIRRPPNDNPLRTEKQSLQRADTRSR